MSEVSVASREIGHLRRPIERAVMLSMHFTGMKTPKGEDFYSHADYDEAMDCLNELVERAKENRIV